MRRIILWTRIVLAYTPATSYSLIINIIYYYLRRCAVCSLLCESYPAWCANVGMTFLRYILHWQLVNSSSTVERGLKRLLSSHSTSCAILSLLGKSPYIRDKYWVAVFFLRDIPHSVQWVYEEAWRPCSGLDQLLIDYWYGQQIIVHSTLIRCR